MKNKLIEDKKQLYKKMFLYKTIFYKNIEFTTNIEDEEVINIINALNIKNKFKRIEFIYNYCCQKIDKYYEGKNVCGFSNNKCIAQQKQNCKYYNGCCRLCSHQSTKGCKTSNLTCKLFYCGLVEDKYKTIKYKDLKILKLLTLRQRIILKDNFFASKEEFIFELKANSLIVYALIELKVIIKNLIICRKLKRRN